MPPSDARELQQRRDETGKLTRVVADLALWKVAV